ncbi:MAG: UMP kinase [Syntrophorhabdaceae bacterium]|nr:UMP kinase [Syntrophorhabdaceae bacterium]
MVYKRVLLKLSGEVLTGSQGYGIDPEMITYISSQIKDIYDLGIEIGIVIGGGNIYRGIKAERQGIDRITGDYMGMIATAINGLALKEYLKRSEVDAVVVSAMEIGKVVEPYERGKALKYLEEGKVLIFICGTGNPVFTTDTAAVLRAMEMDAKVVLKATRVDGIYDKDPEIYNDAIFFHELSYEDVLKKKLKVMDATAITICMEHNIPIIVFNIKEKGNMRKVLTGERIGTIVKGVKYEE